MSAGYRAVVELGLACVAVVGCALSWLHSRATVPVEPVGDGQPVTMSVVYDPPLLLLTLLCATAAGVLAVVGIARLRRLRRSRPSQRAPSGQPEIQPEIMD